MWFCIEMIRRLPEDVRKMREAEEWPERLAILALWVAAGLVLFFCGRFAVGIGERIVDGLKRF